VSCDKEEASITQKRKRPVEECGTRKGESCTNVHWIPHEMVRTPNHE